MNCCQPWSGFNNSTDMCCSGVIYSGMVGKPVSCCGPVLYNTSTEVCCQEDIDAKVTSHNGLFIVPRSFGNNSSCCGGQAYDKSKFNCERFDDDIDFHFNLKPLA